MSERTYPCRCGPGRGMVIETPVGEPTYAHPCPDCNALAYAQWAEGKFDAKYERPKRDAQPMSRATRAAVEDLAQRRKDLL